MIKIKNPNSASETTNRMHHLLPTARHDRNSPVCLVIDGMGIAYAAYFAYSKLSFQGNSTSIIFGVPQMIKSIMLRYRPEKLILCWDGYKHPKRMELLPGYKGHRELKRDPEQRKRFLNEIKKVRILLYRMGITQVHDEAVEGDDMVYMVTKRMCKLYRVIIVSGDKDFHQLINYDVSVYNPRTNEPITTFAFKGLYPIEVPQFVDYLCLVGDDSDDIPGYRGIGPERARKFFEKYYSIRDYLDNKKAEFSGIGDKEELEKLYKRNRKLIDLAYFCKKYYPEDYKYPYYKGKSSPSFNEHKYRAFCIRYNLKTMLMPNFIEVFKNN